MSKLPASHVWWADGHRFTRLIISSSFPTSFRSLQCNYQCQEASGTEVPHLCWMRKSFSCLFYPFLLLSNYATQSHRFQWFLYHNILFMISLRTCRPSTCNTHKYLYKILFPCIILRFLIIPPQRVKEVRNRLVSSFDCFPHGFQTTNPDHQLTFWMMKMLHIRSSCGCKVLAAAVPL